MTAHRNRAASVLAAGIALQLCLGTVYAWSFFQKPITSAYLWSNTSAAWTFSLAICFLGLAAAWGGLNLKRYGPRKLALAGGTLFGTGYLLAALALSVRSLPLLYLGYGVVGGVGLGLGYVTPVATAAKWFPRRKGLVTGLVVMGFGFGALAMSKAIAPFFLAAADGNLARVFLYIGFLMLAVTLPAAAILVNPAEEGTEEASTTGAASAPSAVECLRSSTFIRLWVVFFLNITAGIMFIAFQSPLLQDLIRAVDPARAPEALAAAGATLIAASSVCNGLGRFLWGGLSDRIGRANAFRLILGSQVLAFAALPFVDRPFVFAALVCYVLLCYGGGFGAMPSFVQNLFGAKLMPTIYGAVLTAWSAAGIAGPQIVAALKDKFAVAGTARSAGTAAFIIGAALLSVGFAVSLTLSDKPFRTDKAV